ncbi:hypothetical protein [Halorubellus sp. PRR65]|uniref:hypothetical protein n=1 Tax=Halorubellus sp. PRR65 TaxID=3098148 RepID=UPI002B26391E|nr:hypothetical protein [Halorubellus sp. PRR65]
MGSKRRGILTLFAGALVVVLRGSDEAARLLARGADELLASGGRSADEGGSAASKADELVSAGKRYYRRERLESMLSDEERTDSFSLSPGWYGGYRIETGVYTDLEVRFETRFGTPIDACIFDAAGFEQYERDGEFGSPDVWEVYRAGSDAVTVQLEENTEYWLVFDNTTAGFAQPDDRDVTVEADVSLGLVQ